VEILRAHGLHPIRDRALIDRVLVYLYRDPSMSIERALELSDRTGLRDWER
jgi:hypothetical protein